MTAISIDLGVGGWLNALWMIQKHWYEYVQYSCFNVQNVDLSLILEFL